MIVRPWKAPVKAMIPERPVAARAILTAFSVASAPVVNSAVFFSPGDRRQRVQALGEAYVGIIHRHLEAGVGEALHLLFDGGHHFGMAMAGVDDGDPAGEIDVALALHVPQFGVKGALCEDSGGMADAARDRSGAAREPIGVAGLFRSLVDRHARLPKIDLRPPATG